MAISKVVYDGNTLIDLTSDSVNASNLSKGTTAHNAAGEQIVGTFEQAQSDWNQNDETAVDYVKNRPFYTKNPVETVLVEESTVSFAEAHEGIYGAEILPMFLATAGETYTVYWDGTAYECICVNYMGYPVLGNLSIAFGGGDTGEPFAIMMSNEYIVIYTTDASASHTFSISKVLQEIVKIDTKYLPFMPKPDGESYLTFKSQNSFKIGAHENTKSWNGTLEYFSSDNTWTVWDGTSYLSAVTNGAEYVLYLRGTGNTVITGGQNPFKFLGSDIACIGNIETLLDYVTVEAGEHPTMANNCYAFMFYGWTGLTQAPELPATTLAQSCYGYMFYDCASLTQAPELPATTMASYCYSEMFSYCTSLKQAPKISATTVADYCFYYMFRHCESLARAPELPATTMASYCYQGMFSSCTSLTQAPELPATTMARSCYQSMFNGCTSLTQIPELPATTMGVQCYANMFDGCTSLKLSETKTEEYTQEYRIPSSGDGTTSLDSLDRMFYSTGGTFTGTPNINTTYYLSSGNMIARGNEIATLNGYVQNMIDDAVEIPSTLPNPNAITFTGAVTGVYDGSTPMSVNIPIAPTKTSQLTNDSGFLTSHQDISGKQDKLIAGENIIIASDGKTISATGGGAETLFVTITDNNGTLSADKSYSDILDAIHAGIPVIVNYAGAGLPLIQTYAEGSAFGTIMCDETGVGTIIIEITPNGEVNDMSAAVAALPNPQAITFTGTVTGSYDGSEPLSVNIPTAPTKTSQLTNDSGYLTLETLPKYGGETE